MTDAGTSIFCKKKCFIKLFTPNFKIGIAKKIKAKLFLISLSKKIGPFCEKLPHSRGALPKYTNCILTCIWADGKSWTPAMLFTYNPAFRTEAAGESF
jgi:hypothetical protein